MPPIALPFIAEGWIMQALTSETMLLCAGIVTICALILCLLIRAVIRLGWAQRQENRRAARTGGSASTRLASFLSDTRGTTSIEFALVFPILLILSLLLTQAMMMMAGAMYVNYSAFQATRHATIEIPQDYSSEGDLESNYYSPGTSSLKHERIRRVAYMALVPVAGQIDGSTAGGSEFVNAMTNHFSSYSSNEPKWVQAMLAAKVNYAEANTDIELLETLVQADDDVTFESLPENPYRFGVRDVITVRVIHKLNLGVPFVSRFFSDGDNGAKGPGRYSLITARATLPNEGVPVPLPDRPSIDRVTPALPTSNNTNINGNPSTNIPNLPNVGNNLSP